MGELIQAVILGVIQGLTEFLPVSSSGHLEIAKYLLGDQSVGEASMLMTVVLHFATALSTVVIFRVEVLDLLKGVLRFPQGNWRANEELQFCLKIFVSMVPAAIVGVLLEEQIESLFGSQLLLVGLMLLVTGRSFNVGGSCQGNAEISWVPGGHFDWDFTGRRYLAGNFSLRSNNIDFGFVGC